VILVNLIWSALLVVLCVSADAQQATKIPRIGYISGTGTSSDQGPYMEALRQGLRDLGYVEGKNFVIDYRGADGNLDRIPNLVNEVVQLKVDVLVVPILSAARAAQQATKTIPIVMVTGDPVGAGLAKSLARPGGNLTGFATLSPNLSGKRLELLTEVVSKLTRVGVLRELVRDDPGTTFEEYKAAAHLLRIQIEPLEVIGSNLDLEGAFEAAGKAHVDAIITVTSAPLFQQRKKIAELAKRKRLLSMYQGSAWVESGGLMSYATNELEIYRRAATYVHKLLNGAKPAELPIEQPTKFELVINLTTAKQIGLTIPQRVLLKADRVIK